MSPCHDTTRLQTAVFDIDCLQQTAFSEISAIASLALAALKTPDGYKHFETIAKALLAIRGKADETQDLIITVAEEVGCDSKDTGTERRLAAYAAAAKESSHV